MRAAVWKKALKGTALLLGLCILAFIGVWCVKYRGAADQLIAFIDTPYQVETTHDKTVFAKGYAYRRPGLPVQVTVTGTHYEMGLQYGVLLQDEIRAVALMFYQLGRTIARDEKIPLDLIAVQLRESAMKVAGRLPQRFQDEIQGIADGSGIPVETIYMFNMFTDAVVLMGLGAEPCVSILAKSEDGRILHGRNQDTPFMLESMEYIVVVKLIPDGYRTITSINTQPGYVGVHAAYNDSGLAVTNNGIFLKGFNPEGMSGHHIIRMALEECGTLEDIEAFYGSYNEVQGSAFIWSDSRQNRGVIIETAPPEEFSVIPLQESLLVHSNMCLDQKFADLHESPFVSRSAYNLSRKRIIDNFDLKPAYTVEDLLSMFRADTGPDGRNYNKSAFTSGISNFETIGMVIFDPDRRGFYYATGPYHASWSDVYYYPDDFTKPPVLYAPAIPLEPAVEEVSRIAGSGLYTRKERLEQYLALAAKYPEEAFIQALAGIAAFIAGKPDTWEDYIMRAYRLDPAVPEYSVEAAAIAYYQKDWIKAISYLLSIDEASLSSLEYRGKRLALLAGAYGNSGDTDLARDYQQQIEKLIQEETYQKIIQEYIDKL